MNIKMGKILLTGGRGFFASRFCQYYKGAYEIFAPSHKELDITEEEGVLKAVTKYKPNYIIHTAAIAVTDYCNHHPDIAHKINVDGAVHVAKAARETDAKLVFISSEQVFNGNAESGPYKETDKAVPDTVYGQNKLEAEGLLKSLWPKLWIVRFTWLFGMPQRQCGIANDILWGTIQAVLHNQVVKASDNEFRGMTYVQEMVENLPKLFTLPYDTYHLGAENNKSRYEIVTEIFIALGLEDRIQSLLALDKEKYAKKARDVRLDTSKARQYGLVFSDTSAAIQKCIADYKLK